MNLAHRPIRAPRPGFDGEHVYADSWELLMRRRTSDGEPKLVEVLGGQYRPTLRRAVVAASLICWLGTNCGQSILLHANRRRDAGERNPTLLAWTDQNVRYAWLNQGVRTIEAVLASEDAYGRTFNGTWGLARRPAYSIDDIDTVECVLLWLDSTDGIRFVQKCETEIRERQSERGQQARAAAAAQRARGLAS